MLRASVSLNPAALLLKIFGLLLFPWALSNSAPASAADLRPEEIVTVLPKDAIPAILSPSFDEGRKASWLKGKDLVVGVEIGGDSRAYPFSVLSRKTVVNDTFEGVPLLVVFDEESTTGVIFQRKLEGKTLSFKKAQRSDKKGLLLIDDGSGSVWEGLTGRAIQGPLKDKKLESIPTTPSFWFGWVDHYPTTELYLTKK